MCSVNRFCNSLQDEWLKGQFAKADANKSGILTFGELWALLRSLNLEISEEYGRRTFLVPRFPPLAAKACVAKYTIVTTALA